MSGTEREPVRNREWIAELLERVEHAFATGGVSN
jgi:hypothetical protein